MRAREIGPDNGSEVMKLPGFGIETKPSKGAFDRTGLGRISCVEAKGQAGNVDLVMVAKALLRASERPFRVSGSSGVRAVDGAFVAPTRRALKSVAGERWTD